MVQKTISDPASIAGRNFKKLMEKKGYTQQRFSDEYGVEIRTIRNWYKRIDSLTTLANICELFDVSLQDVLDEDFD